MKEFTFAIITYNHEDYIIDHLESIKRIVKVYGKCYKTNLLVCDDCSNDFTVRKCKDWLKKNTNLFFDVEICVNATNVGTVKNYICTIERTQTEHFKILAGDDMYELFDIYSVYEEIEDSILISHVNKFGNNCSKKNIDYFYLLKEMWENNRIEELLSIGNYIDAPGVFVPGKYLRDKELHQFLGRFVYIEDYPQWMYLIVGKNIKTIIEDKKYIRYRIDSGISSSRHKKNNKCVEEARIISNIFKTKGYMLPNYINPYKYWAYIKNFIIQKSEMKRAKDRG